MLVAARLNRQTKLDEEKRGRKVEQDAARNKGWVLPAFRQTKRGQEEKSKGQVGKHSNSGVGGAIRMDLGDMESKLLKQGHYHCFKSHKEKKLMFAFCVPNAQCSCSILNQIE